MARPVDQPDRGISKSQTGIAGLDAITFGGLSQERLTIVEGTPGAGKTVLGLQSLVHGARNLGEPGIFVAFEKLSTHVVANAASFGWDLAGLQNLKPSGTPRINSSPAPMRLAPRNWGSFARSWKRQHFPDARS